MTKLMCVRIYSLAQWLQLWFFKPDQQNSHKFKFSADLDFSNALHLPVTDKICNIVWIFPLSIIKTDPLMQICFLIFYYRTTQPPTSTWIKTQDLTNYNSHNTIYLNMAIYLIFCFSRPLYIWVSSACQSWCSYIGKT